MRCIGLIGGMSWESTVTYYQVINREIARARGGLHSARIVMHSVDFAPLEAMQHADDWDGCATVLADAGRDLERAGADFLVLATNTMHRVAPQIQAAVRIPLLHIADATGRRIRQQGLRRVGLLGTRFTMEQDFYRGQLESKSGLDVLVPEDDDRTTVHRIIYGELCRGRVEPASRQAYVEVAARLVEAGAQGVIFGCTEIGLLLRPEDVNVPTFDTALIHAEAAAARALEGTGGPGTE